MIYPIIQSGQGNPTSLQDKVICKENYRNNIKKRVSLIIGRIYDVSIYPENTYGKYFKVMNENGIVYSFPEEIFKNYFYTPLPNGENNK